MSECRLPFAAFVALSVSLCGPVLINTGHSRSFADEPIRLKKKTDLSPSPSESAPADELAKHEEQKDALPWLDDLEKGYADALAKKQPVLVVIGTEFCPWCRRLEQEFDKTELQTELKQWVRVELDASRTPQQTAKLTADAFPAIRVLTARGQLIATRDGFVEAGELLTWLRQQREAVESRFGDALMATGEPDVLTVVRIVRQFGHRQPVVREAAVTRLLNHPKIAAGAVIKTLREGKLAERLTALELLSAWEAPIDGLDPWQPKTISAPRLTGLQKWLDERGWEGWDPKANLTEIQIASARDDIDRMLKVDDAEADAIRERLARLGVALLPEVYAQLNAITDDEKRVRLRTLRYRLVASDTLALRWPGGLVRLAATDLRTRQRAADELAELATASEQRLLLELFSDPDPLIRELSLHGLHQVGGEEANKALVELLADPESNVRAAVLKQLAEEPSPAMVPKIVEYVKQEKDPDLLVHAIRFLRVAKGEAALRALVGILQHDSWQVRAEAAEAIGNSSELQSMRYSSATEPDALMVDTYVALLELLKDPDAFVVSRAVASLAGVDMVVAVSPLVGAIDDHPALAASIVEILTESTKMRVKALKPLQDYCRHNDAAVRAAAVAGVARIAPAKADKQIAAALADEASEVRIAAADAVFWICEQHREEAHERYANRSDSSYGLVEPTRSEWFGGVTALNPISRITKGLVQSVMGLAPDDASNNKDTGNGELGNRRTKPGVTGESAPAAQDDDNVADNKASGDETIKAETMSAWDQWLKEYYGGKGRPAWFTPLVPRLRTMLTAHTLREKVKAAKALIPLGAVDEALPVLLKTVADEPSDLDEAGEVLPWLLWPQRLDLFQRLRGLGTRNEITSGNLGVA